MISFQTGHSQTSANDATKYVKKIVISGLLFLLATTFAACGGSDNKSSGPGGGESSLSGTWFGVLEDDEGYLHTGAATF